MLQFIIPTTQLNLTHSKFHKLSIVQRLFLFLVYFNKLEIGSFSEAMIGKMTAETNSTWFLSFVHHFSFFAPHFYGIALMVMKKITKFFLKIVNFMHQPTLFLDASMRVLQENASIWMHGLRRYTFTNISRHHGDISC